MRASEREGERFMRPPPVHPKEFAATLAHKKFTSAPRPPAAAP